MSFVSNMNKEDIFYFVVYIAYALNGLIVLVDIRDEVIKITRFEFAEGWSFVGRPRDDTNDELENFTEYLHLAWPCYVLHAIILYIVRKWWPAKRSIANVIVSLCACFYILSVVAILWLLLVVSSFYICTKCKFNSKVVVWLLAAAWTFSANFMHRSDYTFKMLGYRQYFTLFIALSWSTLRCCSYSLMFVIDARKSKEKDNTKDLSVYNWQHFLGYVLYFPCLVYGPFISFERYKEFILNPDTGNSKAGNWINLLCQLARTIFWLIFLHYTIHYLYVYCMARDVSTFKLLHTGLGHFYVGYYTGQLFFMYYTVTYGVGITFAQFDGLNPPKRPRCIGRIHYYSDMWKHFDEGLYEFLFKHIYSELCKSTSTMWTKTYATAIAFTFVFVWHGCYWFTLLWSCLNFCCLIMEKCFRASTNTPNYRYWTSVRMGLSSANIRRLEAIVGTQIFIFAALSNVFFIGGYAMGKILMTHAYTNGIMNYLKLTLCCYCYFQSSDIIKRWRPS